MSAESTIPLRCRCGALSGQVTGVTPGRVSRVICHCSFCQRYAEALEVDEQLLDAEGGTDLIHLSPRQIEITGGQEHLACLKLTSKGPLRWYAACCNTPIGNTMPTAKVPFVTMAHEACLDREAISGPIESAIGPVRIRVNHELTEAQIQALGKGGGGSKAGFLFRVGRKTLWWLMRGDRKRSPFFDPSGRPRVKPYRLEKGAKVKRIAVEEG